MQKTSNSDYAACDYLPESSDLGVLGVVVLEVSYLKYK
jgi:hypothetical protein